MSDQKIRIQMKNENSDTAYIALPDHPSVPEPCFGVVKKTIGLHEVIDGYHGPRIHLDFNEGGTLIGIEILA